MLETLITTVDEKKRRLDALRPLSPLALSNLERTFDVELTFTSNAIEGNTLTLVETSLVIEHGITVGGKPLKDHLEAIDHHDAIGSVRDLARQAARLSEFDVRNLHALVMRRSDPDIAGRYADQSRYVVTDDGRHVFPSPAEVPALMADFGRWIGSALGTPETAFAAHGRLAAIHPFNDGNGRTARLLMNLVLIRGGFPPVAVRPKDRLAYVRSLQRAQSGGGEDDVRHLLYERLDASLTVTLDALNDALPAAALDGPTSQEPR